MHGFSDVKMRRDTKGNCSHSLRVYFAECIHKIQPQYMHSMLFTAPELARLLL